MWEDKFIPQERIDYLILCDFDSQKRESYATLLRDNNFENDFDIVITDIKIEIDQLYNRYVYGDINNKRENLILKLLSAINNIKSRTMPI